jgi:hypothetical protein
MNACAIRGFSRRPSLVALAASTAAAIATPLKSLPASAASRSSTATQSAKRPRAAKGAITELSHQIALSGASISARKSSGISELRMAPWPRRKSWLDISKRNTCRSSGRNSPLRVST